MAWNTEPECPPELVALWSWANGQTWDGTSVDPHSEFRLSSLEDAARSYRGTMLELDPQCVPFAGMSGGLLCVRLGTGEVVRWFDDMGFRTVAPSLDAWVDEIVAELGYDEAAWSETWWQQLPIPGLRLELSVGDQAEEIEAEIRAKYDHRDGGYWQRVQGLLRGTRPEQLLIADLSELPASHWAAAVGDLGLVAEIMERRGAPPTVVVRSNGTSRTIDTSVASILDALSLRAEDMYEHT